MKRQGLKYFKKVKKPLIKAKRIKFAKDMAIKTDENDYFLGYWNKEKKTNGNNKNC